jgi:transposase
MSNLFWLTDAQMERLRPFFPKSHGKPRVDDRRVLSGIIFINRNGLRWCDAPREYGPPKTLYNRWKRWGEMGVFARMMKGLASEGGQEKVVMIDATYLLCRSCAAGRNTADATPTFPLWRMGILGALAAWSPFISRIALRRRRSGVRSARTATVRKPAMVESALMTWGGKGLAGRGCWATRRSGAFELLTGSRVASGERAERPRRAILTFSSFSEAEPLIERIG